MRLRASSDLSVSQTAQATHTVTYLTINNEDALSKNEPGDVSVPF
jgi:hypothetical protein